MEKITGGTRVTSLGKEAVMGQGGLQSCGLWRDEDALCVSFDGKEGLSKVKLDYKLPADVPAPITAGTPLGELTVSYDGSPLKRMNLVAASDIDYLEPEKPDFLENFRKIFENLLNSGGK